VARQFPTARDTGILMERNYVIWFKRVSGVARDGHIRKTTFVLKDSVSKMQQAFDASCPGDFVDERYDGTSSALLPTGRDRGALVV
jgi:hypothetical protein